jgi:transcriptional regulator with XRE-family HTH domain
VTTTLRRTASKRTSQSTTESEFVPSELRRVFSRNLVAARRTLGMTQRDLAAAAGVSQKHISFIEADAGVNVTLDTLAALAKHVNKTPAELLRPRPPPLSRHR